MKQLTSIVLFKNESENESENEQAPIFSGLVKREGVEDLKVAAWLRYDKNGKSYLSLLVRNVESKWYGAIFKNDDGSYSGLVNMHDHHDKDTIRMDSITERYSKAGVRMLICEIGFDFEIDRSKIKPDTKPAAKTARDF